MSIMNQWIDIEEWGKVTFPDDPPSRFSLIRMGKSGEIYPAPRKIAGRWKIPTHAEIVTEDTQVTVPVPASPIIKDDVVAKIFYQQK